MTKKIIIIGTGGNCLDILDTINDINASSRKNIYKCIGFLDDNPQRWNKKIHGMNVLGSLYTAADYEDCFFVNGIGSPLNFWKKHEIISKTNVPLDRFETIIHPTASISRMSHLGYGCVAFQHVTVTSNVLIGSHVIILPNTVISHEDIIGDFTCIAGGVNISGVVEIGQACYLGSNCSIIGNVKIGNYCLMGMGSVVLNDVNDNTVVVGNPAKSIRRTKED